MALRIFNGSSFDSFMGVPAIHASSNVSLTTSYVAGAAFTAPNTTNYITGVVFFLNAKPTLGNIQVEVRESGVSKVSGVALNADLKLGFNYIRFTTPYKFTTTAAGAYVPYIKNVTNTTGSCGKDNVVAGPFQAITYDSGAGLGATDDVMVLGFHDSGMTPKTLTLTGTANSWGSGQTKSPSSTGNRFWSQASLIGAGGTLKFDTAADCKLTQYGNVMVSDGGTYDQRPGASSVSTLAFVNDADGDFALMSMQSVHGGKILTTGKTVSVAATYNGGAGTAASPATFTAAHGFAVDDELVIGWGGTYAQNEVRFVKSIPSPTSVVWSSTLGGAEAALTYSHANGYPVCNLTRNSIITTTNPARGFSVYNSGSVESNDFGYTRFEYPNCLSGRGLQLSAYTPATTNINGMVMYNNSAFGRTSISWSGAAADTAEDVVLYNTKGSNYSAQSGIVLGSAKRVVRRLYHYAEPGSTTCCAAMSLNAAATACTVDGLWSSGANANNSAGGYALGLYGSGNSLNNVVIDAARFKAVAVEGGQKNEVTNSNFGKVASNTTDVAVASGVLVQTNFLSCDFGSPTLISGYLSALPGSDVGFQDIGGDTSKHRWYTPRGSFWSSGSGLADTTTRTAGSLALAIKPEDAANGTDDFIVRVPANPTSQVVFYGYLYRNATFSSGDIKVELFLPGTLLTDAPDASYTLPTTTGSWLPFVVSAYNPATVARYARVRITAKTATAGAYCFLDDIYDAQTGNKVAGLDLWDQGHISPIIVAADYSSIPEQTRVAVWSDTNDYAVGSKAKTLTDVQSNTDLTQAKVNEL